jgi:hypothetical protein
MEIRPKTAVHRQPPPRGLAQFSRRVGRGCWQVFGLAGMADQSDRFFYWPIFPVSEETSAHWVFDPAYRCGAVPVSHRVLFRRPLGRVTSKRTTR